MTAVQGRIQIYIESDMGGEGEDPGGLGVGGLEEGGSARCRLGWVTQRSRSHPHCASSSNWQSRGMMPPRARLAGKHRDPIQKHWHATDLGANQRRSWRICVFWGPSPPASSSSGHTPSHWENSPETPQVESPLSEQPPYTQQNPALRPTGHTGGKVASSLHSCGGKREAALPACDQPVLRVMSK